MELTKRSIKKLWAKLTGDAAEFSMENRAFNYVSIISFFLLLCYLFFDNYIGQTIMTMVMILLIVILSVCYYFSRVKRKYEIGVLIYAICTYAALGLNYFVNSGIIGPTLIICLITFTFFTAITKTKYYLMWLAFHIIFGVGLLSIEYYHPSWIIDSYPNREGRFFDAGGSYITALIFIYGIIIYLRQYFHSTRALAEARARRLQDQNEHIVKQNKLLEQVNQEKNKLFSIVSHDLKTPLDSVLGYLQVLADSDLEEQLKTDMRSELLEQTRYTSELLANLLTWAKAQMQGMTVNLAPIRLSELVDMVAGTKVYAAGRKGIKLSYSIPKEIEVVGDKNMLEIVIRNLVNNALKFTNRGGQVSIKAQTTSDRVVISVSDTGIGIPKERQEEIFSFNAQSTYGTNNEKGMGIGLHMCLEFVDYQHGKLTVESTPGNGSTFYVTLPKIKI